jgi:hypothetical protein
VLQRRSFGGLKRRNDAGGHGIDAMLCKSSTAMENAGSSRNGEVEGVKHVDEYGLRTNETYDDCYLRD